MGALMLSNSYPMLQFNLGDELNMMRDSLRKFVDTELAPRADEIDRTDTFPRDLWNPMGDMGLHGLTCFGRIWRCRAGLSGAGHCSGRVEPRVGLCRACHLARMPICA
jgi:alkylation response protein AidB-like acyl-CoA dehydrogenase